MSILNSSYEISVWLDKLVDGAFQEERICVIGSDTMLFEGRAIEPRLTRNINGEKKFSFKMYKRFVDTITGEEIENPFSEYLINEAKVKLYYKDKWYDFYVKNVVENSSTYLYTYDLADASVQELSKNGYGVTFDAALMNNLGTAAKLAQTTLEDTDWKVESEVFVERVVDNLVYLTLNTDILAYRIIDQTKLDSGVGLTQETIECLDENLKQREVLGFYSSCKNKPHRFQFIYLPNGYDKTNVQVDQDNNIINADCQYYIEIDSPQSGYQESNGFYIPYGFSLPEKTDVTKDTLISIWYKAKRYGFAQETQYVPLLDKYCGVYKKNGSKYYGYLDSEYTSPVLITNMITNSDFKGNTGWAGTYLGPKDNYKNTVGAKVESICGRFNNDIFQSAMDDLQNETFSNGNEYNNYLKVTYPAQIGGCKGILVNSGFYDNRGTISVPQKGEEWYLEAKILTSSGQSVSLNTFDFYLTPISYDSNTGGYKLNDPEEKHYTNRTDKDGMVILTFNEKVNGLTEQSFKNKSIKLIIYPNGTSGYNQTYYIESISLYKKYINSSNKIVKPGAMEIDGTIINNYVFVPSSELIGDNAKSTEEELTKIIINEDVLNYGEFKPQYNSGAEKVRTITVKESNYFNILQSIAETFECWMDIVITRDEEGTHKTIKFKNFTGDDNYACFRYGVNLKDIQRTYESKQLATKLIVKQNNNQLAPNGFCTIARAGANPTGENYIYDFQYFHKTGLLDATQYQAAMYYYKNPLNSTTASGPDIGDNIVKLEDYNGEINLQNYFNRIKALNNKVKPINDELIDLNMDLLKINADLAVQEGLVEAAKTSIEESEDEFFGITGLYPTEISPSSVGTTVCLNGTTGEGLTTPYSSPYDYKELNKFFVDLDKATVDIKATPTGQSGKSLSYNFKVDISPKEEAFTEVNNIELSLYGSGAKWTDGDNPEDENYWFESSGYKHDGLKVGGHTYLDGYRYKLEYSLTPYSDYDLYNIGSHCQSFKDVVIIVNEEKIINTDVFTFDGIESNPIRVTIYGTFFENPADPKDTRALYIQPNRGLEVSSGVLIKDVKLSYCRVPSNKERTFYIQPVFGIEASGSNNFTYRYDKIAISIPAYSLKGQTTHNYQLLGSSTSLSDHSSTQTGSKIIQEYITYKQELDQAKEKVKSLQKAKTDKEERISDWQDELKKYTDIKKYLNLLFYKQYYRFIQEGTWMSEDYVDDNKYYNDSLSVLYNSCYPQVAYNINILALNKLPGYEAFDFEIGENTYVEDPDFLGQDTGGNDIRVRVAITEMTENLDDPTQDNIKVQNFKNDFADLFHKITATVQQAQYNSGAYEKAVELAEADAELKSAFLQEGLQSMSAALTVGGQDTVVSDTNGITITDSNTKNQLRLVGGAILMGIEDEETGIRKWKTGLTPEGISASLIQAGIINTGIINIMNATEPTFKWDSFGISAYDVDWTGGSPNGRVDPSKFVRYDKYGLYGINSAATANNVHIDGSSWHPSSMDEIRQVANFALTWDGLYLRLGNGTYITDQGKNIYHNSQAMLGKVDNQIFNYWDSNGIPRYKEGENGPEFVKVFAIGSNNNGAYSEELVIYDDGTLTANNVKLTGSVEWTAASSPSKSIFSQTEIDKPIDGTYFNQIPETNAEGWHRVYNREKDLFHCRTDDGGATWQGPIPLTGRSVTGSTIEYTQGQAGLRVEQIANLTGWQNTRPTQLLPNGYCVYTRVQDIYNFGDPSPYRYSADGMNGKDGEDTITCHIESSAGTAFEASATGTTKLTAYIYEGSTEMDLSNKEIYWYIEGQETSFASGNGVTVNIADIRGKTIYFEVDAGGDDTSVLALARVGKMILAKA